MTDSTSQIQNATPSQLAKLLVVGANPHAKLRPEDLAGLFRLQMAEAVSVNLRAFGGGVSAKLRTLTDANGLLLKSLRDLFTHPAPPLELLRLVKDFGKMNRDQPDSVIPREIASMLYYLSIATALARWDERISRLSNAELARGFAWVLSQTWIDGVTRDLVSLAQKKVS